MDNLTPESILVHSDDIVSREIEGELIIVPIASGIGDMEDELYTLNETGRSIWERIDGKRSLQNITGDLAEEYSATPDIIMKDVVGLAEELLKRKILVIKG